MGDYNCPDGDTDPGDRGEPPGRLTGTTDPHAALLGESWRSFVPGAEVRVTALASGTWL
jgi:hypothetical protein